MKINKLSLQKQLLIYLLGFTAAIVVFLWLFQIFVLPTVFDLLKTNDIKNANHEITQIINDDDIDKDIGMISNKYNVCSVVVYVDGSKDTLTNSNNPQSCYLSYMVASKVNYYYLQTLNSDDNAFLEVIGLNEVRDVRRDAEMLNNNFSALVYSTLTDDGDVLIMTNADTVMMGTTIDTLNIILMVSTITLLIVAILLSIFISKKISQPITSLSYDIKYLAKGKYDVFFDYKNNKEMIDLSSTLNYTVGELAKVDSLRKELIANVSHDLKTPLTLISSYGELMRDYPNEMNDENASIIVNEADYLNKLVNDILDLSKYENQMQKLQLSHFDFNSLVNSLIAINRITDIEITSELADESIVYADQIKIRQAITNLLSNALEHAKTKVIIKTTAFNDSLLIEIIDDGDGIAEELQDKVWDRYYRSGDNNSHHSGIGLSVVKKICELHNTKCEIKSTVNQGSTFYFSLPMEDK